MKGYIGIAEELDGQFRDYCESHNLIYKSVDDTGLYRVSGSIFNMIKFICYIKKLHEKYFKEIEA